MPSGIADCQSAKMADKGTAFFLIVQVLGQIIIYLAYFL